MISIMNKKNILTTVIIIGILISAGIWFYFSNKNSSNNNYQASRTSTNNTSDASLNQNVNNPVNLGNNSNENIDNSVNGTENANINNTNPTENTSEIKESETTAITEEQIATFTTKIYSKDSARQNNISITCNTLNNTVVKNGDSFSFCETVGQATTSKGYQKADIFDKDGNKKKGLGGGNCQISTTLYNALLSVPSLVVTERHKHSNYVPYIAKGKDAAVAYGSYDLKFRNDSGNDVKIQSSTDGENVTINLIALKQG